MQKEYSAKKMVAFGGSYGGKCELLLHYISTQNFIQTTNQTSLGVAMFCKHMLLEYSVQI